MSHGQSDGMGDQAPLILENRFSTELHISEPDDDCCQSQNSPAPQSKTSTPQEDVANRLMVPQKVVLSTQSLVAKKAGSHQLIPKNLATSSRPKNRHHTTVVTFPVGLENSRSGTRSHQPAQAQDVSWDDYDSDGDGSSFGRNRRNKSYRAAVTSLDIDAMVEQRAAATLKPVTETRVASPGPARSPGHKVHLVVKGQRCTVSIYHKLKF